MRWCLLTDPSGLRIGTGTPVAVGRCDVLATGLAAFLQMHPPVHDVQPAPLGKDAEIGVLDTPCQLVQGRLTMFAQLRVAQQDKLGRQVLG